MHPRIPARLALLTATAAVSALALATGSPAELSRAHAGRAARLVAVQSGLAPDADFEQAVDNSYATHGPCTFSRADDVAHSPSHSLKIVSATGELCRWLSRTDAIVATPGQELQASVWLRMSGAQAAGLLAVNFWDAHGSYIPATVDSTTLHGDHDWTQVSLQATAPAEAASLRVEFRLNGPGALWADDVEVTTAQAGPQAPVATAAPVVTGTSQVGQLLSGSSGSWTDPQASFAYQWLACPDATSTATCTEVAGATAASFTPAATELGAWLRLRVRAAGTGGTGEALSDALGPVAAAAPAAAGSWVQASPSSSPAARYFASMAADRNGNLVLFGGNGAALGSADTWLWSGSSWSEPALTGGPPARAGAAAASERDGTVVLFGGVSGPTVPPQFDSDSWLWNGSSWTQLPAGASPPARYGAAMATDRNGRVVLFGGQGPAGNLDDTWLFDGSRWTEASPTTRPPARVAASMATDGNGNAVLFGGCCDSSGTTGLGDTWIWNGSDWSQSTSPGGPSARIGAAVAADRAGDIVLFGGRGASAYLSDTWIWDGSGWRQDAPSASPPGRVNAVMAADRSGALVLFSGFSQPGTPNDTWLYSPAGAPEPAPQNLAADGDLEAPPPYQPHGPGRLSWATDQARSGNHSLKITSDASSALNRWVSPVEMIAAAPGSAFDVSVYARTEDVHGAAFLAGNFWTADGTYIPATVTSELQLSGDHDWTKLTLHARAPARARFMRIELRLNGGGSAWFDDLVAAAAAPAPPSITVTSFVRTGIQVPVAIAAGPDGALRPPTPASRTNVLGRYT